MGDPAASERVTVLLRAAQGGDRAAAEQLLPLVYEELRRLAESRMRRAAPGQTLQPTALVHEAYLRLVRGEDPGWSGRGHFFGAAARAMRNIMVEQARRYQTQKRGGGRKAAPLDGEPAEAPVDPAETLALDETLNRLERLDSRKAQIVSLRVYAGLTNEQIASALEISSRTVEREWRFARAWLRRELGSGAARREEPDG